MQSGIPNQFQSILTKNTVILAIDATVIHQKYTINGVEIKNFSCEVNCIKLSKSEILISDIRRIAIIITDNQMKS